MNEMIFLLIPLLVYVCLSDYVIISMEDFHQCSVSQNDLLRKEGSLKASPLTCFFSESHMPHDLCGHCYIINRPASENHFT